MNNKSAPTPKIPFEIVLYQPEIPGNTGSIGRTCVALGLPLHLVHPLGFNIDEKSVRRAGLDYWKFLDLKEYSDWNDFMNKTESLPEQIWIFENQGKENFLNYDMRVNSKSVKKTYLVFGSETQGLPGSFLESYQSFYLPMYSDHIRSLNLSNTATACLYLAIQKQSKPVHL